MEVEEGEEFNQVHTIQPHQWRRMVQLIASVCSIREKINIALKTNVVDWELTFDDDINGTFTNQRLTRPSQD